MHTTPISTSITSASPPDEDQQYTLFLKSIRDRFDAVIKDGRPLFLAASTLDDGPLYDTFLRGLPAERRQHYNCNACRRFVEKFGRLVRHRRQQLRR